jgi:hypothetical protein
MIACVQATPVANMTEKRKIFLEQLRAAQRRSGPNAPLTI